MARLNRAESCDAEQPAEGTKTSILQLCRQHLFGEQTEEGAGSKHIANSAGLGFTGNSTCFIGSENLLRRSHSQLIGAPQPPFKAFLFHGVRELLRIGWGTLVPYKKGSSVPYEEYSKLFDANGYYKLNGERPEKVLEAAIGQERSDPYAAVHEGNESSTHYDCPPEKKKLVDCENCKSSKLGEASEQLLPVDGSAMREVKRGINLAYANFSSMGEKELRRFLHKLAEICSATVRDFCPVPKMSIQLNSASPSDIENTLKAMHTLFTRMDGNGKGLLIVILPEDASSDEKVKDVCENFGIIYHCCFLKGRMGLPLNRLK